MQEAEVSSSPLPVEEVEKLLTFGEAIQEAVSNKRIQREAWPESEYGHFEGDFLHIFRDGKDHTWILSKGDVVENDYLVF